MIAPVQSHHDQAIVDFWVSAWQLAMPEIDFEARRPWILDHLAQMRAGQHVVRGYFEGEASIGFYTLFADTGLIEQICVSPRAKGQGIGALLVADAALHARNDLNLVVNEDNLAARRFYAKLGFVETGRGVNPASSKPVLMLQKAAETPR